MDTQLLMKLMPILRNKNLFRYFHKTWVALIIFITPLSANEIIITIPKTGTNLLLKLIFLIDQANGIDLKATNYNSAERTNKPYWLHVWRASNNDEYTLGPTEKKVEWIKKSNLRLIILLRDPRSLIFSLLRKDTDDKVIKSDFEGVINRPLDRLNDIIGAKLFSCYPDLSVLYLDYLQWGSYPFTYTAYFENLVGPSGGGSRFLQISEIINIANHIGKPITKEQAKNIANNLFGETKTFHTGRIDSWKTELTGEQLKKLDDRYGTLVDWLGYPIK